MCNIDVLWMEGMCGCEGSGGGRDGGRVVRLWDVCVHRRYIEDGRVVWAWREGGGL